MSPGVRLMGWSLAWLSGVMLHLQCRSLWPWSAQCALLLCGALAWLAARRRRRAWPLALIGAFFMGVGASGLHALERLDDALSHSLEGEDIVLTGRVDSLPQVSHSSVRFEFAVETSTLAGQQVSVPRLVALGWFAPGFHADEPALSVLQTQLRADQRWRFTVRLRRPHGNVNPHGFDQELHLFERGLRATGSIRNEGAALMGPARDWSVDHWRGVVRDAIGAQVVDRRAGGVLAALTVGDQSAIDREDWQVFRNTGVAHLVAISGLHITMFAWVAGNLAQRFWRLSPRAMAWLAAQHAGAWVGLAAAFAYAVFSGWGVPSQRTVWMLAVAAGLRLSGRKWPWPVVLLTTAVAVSVLDPWALLQAGFWLSFTAVGLLMASEPVQRGTTPDRAASRWRRWVAWTRDTAAGSVRTQLIATVGLAPLSVICFQQISLVGFLANLVAIPWVTLLVTPLALLGLSWHGLWAPAAWLVQQMTAGLQWLDQWPLAVWSVPAAPWWAQAFALLGAALLVMPLPWRLRLLSVPLALPLWMPPGPLLEDGQFELLAADVGQGTSVLVRTRRHFMVFDAGPQYSQEADAGQRILIPLLAARGDRRIDRLVLSHRDTDHVGGAAALLNNLPVGDLLSSLEPAHPLRALVRADTRCEEGQSWEWDGVHFAVLHPSAEDHGRKIKPNGLSCVIRVSGLHASALLTGDIEKAQEDRLVQAGALPQSDILIVPHHGSRTSSTSAFLDAVRPQVAIIQAGYRNRFGHPVAEVLTRLRVRSVQVHSTASCGAWHWPGQGPVTQGRCQRSVAPRYWHDAPE